MSEEVTALFRDVLLYCDELGLIGKEMFAIDGCKLPFSKEWSGTRAEKAKMGRAVRYLLKQRRQKEAPIVEKEREQIKTLKAWLSENEDKPGKTGRPKKSNLTDNESAKMQGGHRDTRGYDGVAAVDSKHRVIVHAEAFGEPQEHGLLMPMVEGARENFRASGESDLRKKARYGRAGVCPHYLRQRAQPFHLKGQT
jgi:hypothetical protein